MTLHDSEIVHTMGCGIAGLSIVADSLSGIKYAKVTPVRDETGLVADYITEGVFPVYGKATGAFPSGHEAGTLFAPGANPENGLDSHGMLASMLSVGKLDYEDALDGISLTNTITPAGLGRTKEEQVSNLVGILDAGFIMDESCPVTA